VFGVVHEERWIEYGAHNNAAYNVETCNRTRGSERTSSMHNELDAQRSPTAWVNAQSLEKSAWEVGASGAA